MAKRLSLTLIAFVVGLGIGFYGSQFFKAPDDKKVLTSVDSFEECVEAGNAVMESYPRQCRSADGRLFVEDVSLEPVPGEKSYISNDVNQCKAMFFGCPEGQKPFFDDNGCGCENDSDNKPAPGNNETFCTTQYDPVCGKIQVQCIKAPCPPIEQTFSNSCFAEKAGAFDIRQGEC